MDDDVQVIIVDVTQPNILVEVTTPISVEIGLNPIVEINKIEPVIKKIEFIPNAVINIQEGGGPTITTTGGGGGSAITGYWEPVTNGWEEHPEIIFSDGDIVMTWRPTDG